MASTARLWATRWGQPIASGLLLGVLVWLSVTTVNAAGVQGVRVTDVRSSSFVVSWISPTIETGLARYGPAVSGSCESVALVTTQNDSRGISYTGNVHYVSITGLDTSSTSTYCVQPISGGVAADVLKLSLGPTGGLISPDSVLGRVVADGQGATDVVVYANLTANGQNSATVSQLVRASDAGYFIFNLSGFRSSGGASFQYTDTSELVLSVAGGIYGTSPEVRFSVGTARATSVSPIVVTLVPPTFTPSPTSSASNRSRG